MSYGVTEIPVVVINRNKVLNYNEITPERLDTEIQLAESGAYPIPEKRKTFSDGDGTLSVFFSFILGLMTGFSPCLLGSLVVLIAAANGPHSYGKDTRYHPLIFGAGIITAYLLVTAFILGLGVAIVPDYGYSTVIRGIAGFWQYLSDCSRWGYFPSRIGWNLRYHLWYSGSNHLPGFFFSELFLLCFLRPVHSHHSWS